MAIYKYGVYASSLIRDGMTEPQISTPENGEETLLLSLAKVEDYSYQLILEHRRISQRIKDKIDEYGEISKGALSKNIDVVNGLKSVADREINEFDNVMKLVEELSCEFDCIDNLCENVEKLDEMLSSLEKITREKP